MTLAGRVAVVSGAGAPVGRAISLALGRAGAAVGLVGPGPAGATLDGLAALGVAAAAVPAELDRRDQTEAAFAQVAGELGPVRLVVHSWVPAVALERRPMVEVDDERWGAVWEATMTATIVFLQSAFASLRGRGGRIVVVTPTAWTTGVPGLAPYSAAVEGQRLLAKSAARQWGGEGITVNCVAPAWETVVAPEPGTAGPAGSMSLAAAPLAAVDLEADVGAAIVALAGDEARGVTGATVCVDGGAAMAP